MNRKFLLLFQISCLFFVDAQLMRRTIEDKTKCPQVRPIRNFDLEKMLGQWYVIQYYASSEEAASYRCMKSAFTATFDPDPQTVTMNFTYKFIDDPLEELLLGNITWTVPNPLVTSHWTHSEDTYEGIYNTYVLDSDYTSWALLLHCAEKEKVPRYLSSFIMSRQPHVGFNVISYLRDKLPRYDIDVNFMFDMAQNDCNVTSTALQPNVILNRPPIYNRRHPMKHHHAEN